MAATWMLHDNGTFDLVSGPILLAHCYPGLDGEPVHPQRIEITRDSNGGRIAYHTARGSLVLDLEQDSRGPALQTTLRDFGNAPHWVYPLAAGRVSGAHHWYKQGLGFSGPSGLREIHTGQLSWALESYLCTALVADDGQTVALGALRHHEFLQRCTLSNRQRRCGLCDRHVNSEDVLLEAGFSTERIVIEGHELRLPALHFVAGDQPFDTLRRLASMIAEGSGVPRRHAPRYHWCSWYEYHQAFSRDRLDALIAGLKTAGAAGKPQTLQIDTGYSLRGDWLECNERWAGGLQAAFKAISDAGYQAGIWIGPFMVRSQSRLFREHPDWLVHDHDGNLLEEWGHRDTYVLDTSNPDAFEYLRTVFGTLRSWGATFFKTDFMDWGLKDSLSIRRHTPGRTSVQYYADVLRMIREEIGPESYWLACIAPFPPFVGFADGMRVANDVSPVWHPGGLGNMLEESVADQYFNNVLWQNDNDVLYLRTAGEPKKAEKDPDIPNSMHSRLSEAELESLALWNAVLGGSVNCSDRFHLLARKRVRLWQFVRPHGEAATARLPRWGHTKGLLLAALPHRNGTSWSVLGLNNSEQPLATVVPVLDLVGKDKAFCAAWKVGDIAPLEQCVGLGFNLQPHQSQLYFVSSADLQPAPTTGLYGEPVDLVR